MSATRRAPAATRRGQAPGETHMESARPASRGRPEAVRAISAGDPAARHAAGWLARDSIPEEPPALKTDPSSQALLRLADQCVKCGLCLPHCPTYDQARNEADSPRGRIALIQGWVAGELEMTPRLAGHLDGCLGCRACETACPSLVAFGRLADAAKARRVARLSPWRHWVRRVWLETLSDSRLMKRISYLSRVYRSTGLARLARALRLDRIPRIAPYLRLATAIGPRTRRIEPCNQRDAEFDLFLGCTGASLQGPALEATIQVCARLALRARIAPATLCCGALLRHNGYPIEADRRRADCVRVHTGRTLVGIASACVAELREEPALEDTQEICAFLDRLPWPESLELRPLRRRVLVHEPCSHRNLLGGNAAVYRLLARIPKLQVEALPGNDHCCGAAGTYLLQQPLMAEALLQDKLARIHELQPDIIVTTNPGCEVHLAAGIGQSGLGIEVCHPLELIARQLPDPSEDEARHAIRT